MKRLWRRRANVSLLRRWCASQGNLLRLAVLAIQLDSLHLLHVSELPQFILRRNVTPSACVLRDKLPTSPAASAECCSRFQLRNSRERPRLRFKKQKPAKHIKPPALAFCSLIASRILATLRPSESPRCGACRHCCVRQTLRYKSSG